MNEDRQEVFNVLVDYSQSLKQMIDAGCFDKVHRDITPRNFRLEAVGCREVELTLVQFVRPKGPVELVTLMRTRGYRPATIEELLALASVQPSLQRSIPIAALRSGCVLNGRRYVPCLGGSQSTRELNLVVIYRKWSIYYRFAFVRR